MIEHVMPLCLTISWVYTVAMLVQSIVYEKEQRLKEVQCSFLVSRYVQLMHCCSMQKATMCFIISPSTVHFDDHDKNKYCDNYL